MRSGYPLRLCGDDWSVSRIRKSAASQGKTTITFSSYPNLISGASYPSDPIIGKYEVIYVPPHPTQYDYKLEKKIAPGIWSLSGGQATIALSASSDPRESTNYLTGVATATTIDFNTGTVSWSTVDQLTTSLENLSSSKVLADFSNYSVGSLSYSFSVTDELKRWINSNSSSSGTVFQTSYWTRLEAGVAGVPEPSTWLLLLFGLSLMFLVTRLVKGEEQPSISV